MALKDSRVLAEKLAGANIDPQIFAAGDEKKTRIIANKYGEPAGSIETEEPYVALPNQWKYKNPVQQAAAIQGEQAYVPFKVDKKKYPDVEETPYGFIFNVNGRSITDAKEQARQTMPGHFKPDRNYGFTLTANGDEAYYEDFDQAYKAAKGIK